MSRKDSEMTINQRSKGARGEREVAKIIREWWSKVEPKAEFVKTPGSGGWQGKGFRGQSLRSEFRMSGDLMTTSKRFPFSIEVKFREAWSYANVVRKRASPVWGWWRQCVDAARECGAVPMLWFRRARGQWLVMLGHDYAMTMHISPPKCAWTVKDFPLGNIGNYPVPILFDASTVLGCDPKQLALPKDKVRK